jgi:hypothetical protein
VKYAIPFLFGIPLLLGGVVGCRTTVKPVAELSSQSAPAKISVLSERRVGDALEVTVALEPVAVWPASGVSIDVTTLRDGEELHTTSVTPRARDGLLRPGESVPVTVSALGAGMTDYRLDVRWGGYGEAHRASLGVFDSQSSKLSGASDSVEGTVELADPTLSVIEYECGRAVVDPAATRSNSCGFGFRYSAKLQNRTERLIDSVVLVAHFVSASGERGEPAELEVADLKLSPGEQRSINVTFDAPEELDGPPRGITPRLEVKSFN